MYLQALFEIGLVLFGVTILINLLAQLLLKTITAGGADSPSSINMQNRAQTHLQLAQVQECAHLRAHVLFPPCL